MGAPRDAAAAAGVPLPAHHGHRPATVAARPVAGAGWCHLAGLHRGRCRYRPAGRRVAPAAGCRCRWPRARVGAGGAPGLRGAAQPGRGRRRSAADAPPRLLAVWRDLDRRQPRAGRDRGRTAGELQRLPGVYGGLRQRHAGPGARSDPGPRLRGSDDAARHCADASAAARAGAHAVHHRPDRARARHAGRAGRRLAGAAHPGRQARDGFVALARPGRGLDAGAGAPCRRGPLRRPHGQAPGQRGGLVGARTAPPSGRAAATRQGDSRRSRRGTSSSSSSHVASGSWTPRSTPARRTPTRT